MAIGARVYGGRLPVAAKRRHQLTSKGIHGEEPKEEDMTLVEIMRSGFLDEFFPRLS
jgi:hypothetical protein